MEKTSNSMFCECESHAPSVSVCVCVCAGLQTVLFFQALFIQNWSGHQQLLNLPENSLHYIQVNTIMSSF